VYLSLSLSLSRCLSFNTASKEYGTSRGVSVLIEFVPIVDARNLPCFVRSQDESMERPWQVAPGEMTEQIQGIDQRGRSREGGLYRAK